MNKGLSEIIPEKPISEKERQIKEYELKLKLITRKPLKQPFKIHEHREETKNLLKEMYDKKLINKKKYEQKIIDIDKGIIKANKKIENLRGSKIIQRIKEKIKRKTKQEGETR